MGKIENTTNTIHWAYKPIGYKNEDCSPEKIKAWVTENTPNIIQRSTPLTIGGVTGIVIAGVTGIFSFIKEIKAGKILAGLLGLVGAIATGIGFYKQNNLRTVNVVSETVKGAKPFTSKSDVIGRVKSGMEKEAEIMAERLNLDPQKLKALLPEVLTLDECLKAQLNTKESKEELKKISKEDVKRLPPIFIKNLPEDIITEVFPDGLPEEPSSLLFGSGPLGGYISNVHKIGVDLKLLENGQITPEEVGHHEGNHALEAILRSLLTKDEIGSAIKQQIKEEITKGISLISHLETGAYIPPQLTSKELRSKLADFTVSILNGVDKNDNRIDTTIEEHDIKYTRINDRGKEELRRSLSLKSHNEFLQILDGNENDALTLLCDFIEKQIIRYRFSMGILFDSHNNALLTIPENVLKTLPISGLTLTTKAKELAICSTKECLSTFEGNARMMNKTNSILSMPGHGDVISYWFAPEEVRCNRAALNALLKVDGSPKEQIKNSLKVFELGEKLMELRKKLATAPQKTEILSPYYKIVGLSIQNNESGKKIDSQIKTLQLKVAELEDSEQKTIMLEIFSSYELRKQEFNAALLGSMSGDMFGEMTLGLKMNSFWRARQHIIDCVPLIYKDLESDVIEISDLVQKQNERMKNINLLGQNIGERGTSIENRLSKTNENLELVRFYNEVIDEIKKISPSTHMGSSLIALKPLSLSN